MDKNAISPEEEEMGVHEKVRRHLETSYYPLSNGYHNDDKIIANPVKNNVTTKIELPPGN